MKHKNNVIFKQRIQRIVFWPQTIIILLFATFIIAVDIVLIVSALETYTEHFETVLLLIFLISLLFCSPVFIVLDNFEWFEIYEDRIICRCICTIPFGHSYCNSILHKRLIIRGSISNQFFRSRDCYSLQSFSFYPSHSG